MDSIRANNSIAYGEIYSKAINYNRKISKFKRNFILYKKIFENIFSSVNCALGQMAESRLVEYHIGFNRMAVMVMVVKPLTGRIPVKRAEQMWPDD